MYKDIREDIYKEKLVYTYLSFISQKLRVGIIGGGKAGYLKSKSFLSRGCRVEVLSINFIDEFYSLKDIKLIKGEYKKEFIKDKHLIIIATDDNNKNLEIKRDCDEEFKIYIFTSNFLEGMAVTPVQGELNNISFALSTKGANPRGSLILESKIYSLLKNYDDFIGYSSFLREKAKLIKENKSQIITFICSEDFKYIYEKGKDKVVMELFFGKEIVSKLY